MTTDTKFWASLLDSVKDLSESYLRSFAVDPAFDDKMILAFGKTSSEFSADWLASQVTLPDIEVSSVEGLNGAYGAFSPDTGKIYLSEELLESDFQELITAVFLEEYGHFVDAQLNTFDSPGDEGAIFSSLVRGKDLSIDRLQQLKGEDDRSAAVIGEEFIGIEQATVSDSGGFEGSQQTLQLESNGGGIAEYEFEFYSIPDQFIIRYEGQELVNTGFVGGFRSGQVEIPEGNSDQLEVIVATNDEGTAWDYTVTTEDCPKTDPLFIELANGDFEDTDGDGGCDGQGTVYVGYTNAIQRMIRIENTTAEYDEQSLTLTGGTVFSEIGNISEPLFEIQGDLVIPFATTAQSQIQEATRSDALALGGLETDFTRLTLLEEGISLDGSFTLPDDLLFQGLTLGDRKVEFTGQDSLFIGTRGIGFGSAVGKVGFPTTSLFTPFDFLGITNTNADIAYIREENGQIENKLKIQGKFKIQTLDFVELDPKKRNETSLELDLSDDRVANRENFIQIKDGESDIQGQLKLRKIPLPFEFSLEELDLDLTTENGQLTDIAGKTKLQLPLKTKSSILGELGFKKPNDSFVLDNIGIGVDDLNLPVIFTPLFLQRVQGSVNNLAPDNVDTSYKGGLGFTFGRQFTFNPPSFLSSLISPVTASLVRLDGDFESNGSFYTGTGKLQLIEDDILEASGRITWDLDKKLVEAPVSIKAFGNTQPLIEGTGDLKINYSSQGGSFSLFGDVTLKFPDDPFFFGLRNKEITGASLQSVVSFDENSSNDYIASWGSIFLPVVGQQTVGLQVYFDGDFDILGSKNIPPSNSFDVEVGTQWILLTASWENATNEDVIIRVINQNGDAIDEADFAANNIAIVDDLTGSNAKTVIVANPSPGVWDLEVVDATGLGDVQISASRDSAEPGIEITSPATDVSGTEITIGFNAIDPDSNAEIQLFYDSDDQGFDGILIADQVAENDGAGIFTWNTQGIAPGNYFIYGLIQDENNAPILSSYSQGRVLITEEADLSVVQTTDNESVAVGSDFKYVIKVTNNSSIEVTGVTLEETLPDEVTFVSATVAQLDQTNNVLTFNLGNLEAGETSVVEVTVTAPQTIATITGTAAVRSKIFDPNISNDTDSLTISVEETELPSVELELTRTESSEDISLGDDFTFTLTVTNNGPNSATVITLTEILPSGVDFVSAKASQGIAFQDFNGNVIAQLGDLESGESATVEVTVNAFTAGSLVGTTSVTSNETEINILNNYLISRQAINSIAPANVDLELTQIVENLTPSLGEQVTLRFAIGNKGPGTATGIKVASLLPSGLTFISATPEQGTYDETTGIWDVGNVRDNLERTLSINALVDEPGTLTIDAEVIAVNETDVDSTPNNDNPDEDDQVSVTLNVASIAPSLTKVSDDVFTLAGTTPKLKVSLVESKSTLVNELAVFTVDDTAGNIDGLTPGSEGYAQAALAKSRPIFSSIADIPTGFDTTNLSTLLEFDTTENLRFILVKNDTLDNVKNGITPISDLLFSNSSLQQITDLGDGSFSLAWKDSSGNTTDFKDLVVKIEATTETSPLGTAIQNQSGTEIIDLRDAPALIAPNETVKAEFSIYREAAFNNYVGFYKIDDTDGSITDSLTGAILKPGDSGYIQTAVQNRIAGIDLSVANQSTATLNGEFTPGSLFAPFIIVNASPTEVLDANAANDPAVYFAFIGANPDGVDHIRLLASNVFGFEDLPNGGDLDYNDVIVTANLVA